MERDKVTNEKLLAYVESIPGLKKAYDFAEKAHAGQSRKDGTTHFDHCLEVARIIYSEWGIADQTILSAALLHDTVEDTDTTSSDLESSFGTEVADLVGGVSKFRSETDRETVRRVFDTTLINPKVGVLKLADRLHNMRTMDAMPPKNQKQKADETMNVYAPLAESLGMWIVMRELEDLSLRHISEGRYATVFENLGGDPRITPDFIGYHKSRFEQLAIELGVQAGVEVRATGLERLRRKLEKQPSISRINDLVSFRVICDSRDDCYRLLGYIREVFSGIEDQDRFDDFFFSPRDNDYSAIHVTLDTPGGSIEVAVTTREREELNNWGVVELMRRGEENLSEYALKLLFTPSGQVKFFPKEATGVDFAYSISPSLGMQAVGLLVDGAKMPLSTVLKNGVEVEVLTDPGKNEPTSTLINYALPRARNLIKQQIREGAERKLIDSGKDKVLEVIARRGLADLIDLYSFEGLKNSLIKLLDHLGCKGSLDRLYLLVGSDAIGPDLLGNEMDKFGLSEDVMKLTTVVIVGTDGPGILQSIVGEISREGYNIGALNYEKRNSRVSTPDFEFRLVIEGFPREARVRESLEDELKNALTGHQIFSVMVV